jgi:2-dehydro-3-deoxygluconokinase
MKAPKVITLGEIMLRLSTPDFGRFIQARQFNVTYGGGEANVTLSLAHMGIAAGHVTRFPDNDMGRAATALFRTYGVDMSHVVYGGDRLGIYFLETGASVRPSKVVYDRAGSSFASISKGMVDWDAVFADATWFHWTGITPAISQGAADVCLEAITEAQKRGLTVSGDLNYRKNLWKYGKTAAQVMPELTAGCDIVFASKGDMEEILGQTTEPVNGERFLGAAQALIAKFPSIKQVVNTKRTSVSANHNTLSAMSYIDGVFNKTDTLEINPIIDRIGGGDAFAAGYIYGIITYNDPKKALEFALAAGVIKHSIEGDANLASVEEIEAIMRGEVTGKLAR